MKPYKQNYLSESIILREFSSNVSSNELVWHRDKKNRTVLILEGSGWQIQLDGKLPISLIPGQKYYIPANTYHRVVKGNSNLKIVISEQKEQKVKITKRQLKRIIKEEYNKLRSDSLLNEGLSNAKKIMQMLFSGNKRYMNQALMLAKNIGLIEKRKSKDYWHNPGWGLGMVQELDVIVIDPELIHEINQWEKTLSHEFKVSYHWEWNVTNENRASLSFHVYSDSTMEDIVTGWGEDAKAPRYDDMGRMYESMSDTSGFQFGKLEKPTSQPSTDPIELAYEEGFDQGRHDAIEGMESEVLRYMFKSQEEYDAFLEGYQEAMEHSGR